MTADKLAMHMLPFCMHAVKVNANEAFAWPHNETLMKRDHDSDFVRPLFIPSVTKVVVISELFNF
jgi:hypothetical protein